MLLRQSRLSVVQRPATAVQIFATALLEMSLSSALMTPMQSGSTIVSPPPPQWLLEAEHGVVVATNQDYNSTSSWNVDTDRSLTDSISVTQQLNDGIRMLQMQAHNLTGVIELCHTSCVRASRGPLSSCLTP
jgi:hypothetical protein